MLMRVGCRRVLELERFRLRRTRRVEQPHPDSTECDLLDVSEI